MDIDIFQLPGIVRKRIHYVVLVALACSVLALGFVLTQKPFYRSTVELYVDISRGPVVGTDTGEALNMQQIIGSQLYLIQSRDVLRDVVTKLDLTNDPYFNQTGLVARVLGRPKADGDATDGVINALLENTAVERNGDSFVFTVTVKHGNSQMAAKIANAIGESYLRIVDAARLDVNLRTTHAIAEQAEGLRKRVLEAQAAVETFRSDNGLISTGEQGLITDQQLSGLNQQLIAARQQVEQQKTIFDQAKQLNISNVESGAIPETLNSAALTGLRSRYAQALDRQAELSANLGSGHPQMRAVRSQIASIREATEKELGRVRQMTANTYERAKVNLAAVEKRFDEQTTSTKDNGRVRFRLAQLISEAEAIDSVYRAFITRAEELGRQQGLGSGNSRIISDAVPSSKAVQAPKLLVLIAAILFGAAAGAALAVARELFAGTKRFERTLVGKTGAPVILTMEGTALPDRPVGAFHKLGRLLPFHAESAQHTMPHATGVQRLTQLLQAEFGSERPTAIVFVSPDGSGTDGIASSVARELHLRGEVVLFSRGEARSGSRGRSLEDMLHFDRIGSGIQRKFSVLSSSRVSTGLRQDPPDHIVVDCRPENPLIPAILRQVDGVVIASRAGGSDGDSLDALMSSIGPWREKIVGNVILFDRAA